jgi:hypothetical protein
MVQAWLEDVELKVPYVLDYQSEVKRASKDGFISGPASAISKVTSQLTKVPVIGQFAHALSIGTNAVSSIAKLFGFSRPTDLDPHTTVGFIQSSVALGAIQTRQLTLDPAQTVDTAVLQNHLDDTLTYANIVGRPGLLRQFTMAVGDAVGTVQVRIPVAPGICSSLNSYYDIQATPLAFGSIPFMYWRGSIKYTFDICASKYHRGRYRILWNPTTTLASTYTDTSLSAYHVDFDLASSTIVEITVSYMNQDPYLRNGLYSIDNLNVSSNGFLIMYPIIPLAAPVSSAPLTVSVWVRAGDDFELALPEPSLMNTLHRQPCPSQSKLGPITSVVQTGRYSSSGPVIVNFIGGNQSFYQSQSLVERASPLTYDSAVDKEAAQVNTISATFGSSSAGSVASQYIGERFQSFRPLLKRFSGAQAIINSTGANTNVVNFIPWRPIEPGAYVSTDATTTVACANWSYTGFFEMLFRGARGSMRVNVVPYDASSNNGNFQGGALIYKAFERKFAQSALAFPTNVSTWTTTKFASSNYDRASELFHNQAGQTTSFTIPYQLPYNYQYNYMDFVLQYNQFEPGAMYCSGNSYNRAMYAAGEDYMPVIWAGVPTLFSWNVPITVTGTFVPAIVELPPDEKEKPPNVDNSASIIDLMEDEMRDDGSMPSAYPAD